MTDIDAGLDSLGNVNDPAAWLKANPNAPKWLREMVALCAPPGTIPRPPEVALGRNGRWEKIGDVSVDSATIAITDPAFAKVPYQNWKDYNQLAEDWGSGVQILAGFGDGGYDVWAWIADYGEDGEVDERIGQVVITLIDDKDVAEWRTLP